MSGSAAGAFVRVGNGAWLPLLAIGGAIGGSGAGGIGGVGNGGVIGAVIVSCDDVVGSGAFGSGMACGCVPPWNVSNDSIFGANADGSYSWGM